MTQLINKEIWREDVIEIEKRKWLEKISGVDIFKLKYERTKEVMNYIELQPHSDLFFEDIGLSRIIKIKP